MRRIASCLLVFFSLFFSHTAASAETSGSLAMLYARTSKVRAETLQTLAAEQEPELLDDLVRAWSVDWSRDNWPMYKAAVQAIAGRSDMAHVSEWKAWLEAQEAVGLKKRKYAPLGIEKLSPAQKEEVFVFAVKSAPEDFPTWLGFLEKSTTDTYALADAVSYLVMNDNLPVVRAYMNKPWVFNLLKREDLLTTALALQLSVYNEIVPMRSRIEADVRAALTSTEERVTSNAMQFLYYSNQTFTKPLSAACYGELKELSQRQNLASARTALAMLSTITPPPNVTAAQDYEEVLQDLHKVISEGYPFFQLKGINWDRIGKEFIPRAAEVKNTNEFGLLCMEMVAKLEDTHAELRPLKGQRLDLGLNVWEPGVSCIEDDQHRPVVYYVRSDLRNPGIKTGMVVLQINGQSADAVLSATMTRFKKYMGYSSTRALKYDALHALLRQPRKGDAVNIMLLQVDGTKTSFTLSADYPIAYIPRLPVPIEGIRDDGSIEFRKLSDNIGYIYVRRIDVQLESGLDRAVAAMTDCRGIIIDVRGNSGGGFDANKAFVNFDPSGSQSKRPVFKGPIAVLLDERCVSAGEGWASWFIANKRARTYGSATTGASSAKRQYTLLNEEYSVRFSTKGYKGSLDRLIEKRGLEPDVPVKVKAADLARGVDTVLEKARQDLLGGK